MTDHFRRWWKAGFRPLISVTRPDWPVRPEDWKQGAPADLGKTPGFLRDGHAVPLGGWSTFKATPEHVKRWDTDGANLGLLAAAYPAFDLDTNTADATDLVAAIVHRHAGSAPIRLRGESPRKLLLFRLEGPPIRKHAIAFVLEGVAHKVELLGDGQQFVAAGTHPSGETYRWRGDVRTAALSHLTLSAVETIFAEIRDSVEMMGGTVLHQMRSHADGDRYQIDAGSPMATADRDQAARALIAIPCADLPYEHWIAHLAAFKAAVAGDPAYLETAQLWSEGYPDNTPETVEAKWDSLAETSIGADWLFSRARPFGYDGPGTATDDFGAIEAEPAAPASTPIASPEETRDADDMAGFVRRFVYVADFERYVDLSTMHQLSEGAFRRFWVKWGSPWSSSANAAMLWQMHPDAVKLSSITYRPGGARVVREDDGRNCLNTWRPPRLVLPEAATDGDVAPWLELGTYLIPDTRERGLVLDWMAYRLQHLDRKANFALLLGGAQGLGKNAFVSIVLEAGLGIHNVKGVDQDDVDGQWSDWAAESALVTVEEIYHFGPTTLNRLKKYITVPPDQVRINGKNAKQVYVPNAAAFLAYTNHFDALQIERGDRRWMVVWSPAAPRSEGYYAGLIAWLRGGGAARAVRWLLQRDLSAFAAQGRAPETDAKEAMREAAASPVEQWVAAAVRDRVAPFGTDLVAIEDVLGRLPRHLSTHKPTHKRVSAGIREAGGVPLRQVRLGQALLCTGAERAVLWAVRDAGRYADMAGPALAELFWTQRGEVPPDRSQALLDDFDVLSEVAGSA